MQAKALAFAMGADYLEQDIVATRDDRLVVLHDIHLDRVTDVAERFPRRSRADGRYYVRDFDLDEILTLTVHERVDAGGQQVFPQRLAHSGAEFRVHTLERELALVATLRDNTGRDVGIYPEIKAPAWHVREGVDITALVLETLRSAGYAEHADPVYLQCFDAAEVRRIRHELGCALKLVQLIGVDSFFVLSVFVDSAPYGLFYADRREPACALDARSFEDFKRLFSDEALRPDELKIYPCVLVENSELVHAYERDRKSVV